MAAIFTPKIGYADNMRRYSFYIVLLLSFLLPLHVAASTLFSAQTCPEESAMVTDVSSDEAAPDCCDELNKTMDCQQMQSCHGCNINCQLFTSLIPEFNFSLDAHLHSLMNTPTLGLFDPASVWRPPTNS